MKNISLKYTVKSKSVVDHAQNSILREKTKRKKRILDKYHEIYCFELHHSKYLHHGIWRTTCTESKVFTHTQCFFSSLLSTVTFVRILDICIMCTHILPIITHRPFKWLRKRKKSGRLRMCAISSVVIQ